MGNRKGLLPLEGPDGPLERGRSVRSLGVAAVVLLIVVASTLLYQTNHPGPSVPEREYYDGRYWDYYETYGLGPTFSTAGSVRLAINDTVAVPQLPESEGLPVLMLRLLSLDNRSDAEAYLATLNYSVLGFEHSRGKDRVEYHTFTRGSTYISLRATRELYVSYGSSPGDPTFPNITQEDAIQIASSYLENHTGLPDGAEVQVSRAVRSDGKGINRLISFSVFFLGTTYLGHPCQGQFFSRVHIDASTGRVDDFQYIWPELDLVGTIGPRRLANMTERVQDFIEENNEMAQSRQGASEYVVNITDVRVIYKRPFGVSGHPLYEGSPSCLLIPFIEIGFEHGYNSGYLSPLRAQPKGLD